MPDPRFVFTAIEFANTSDDNIELHLEPWAEVHELSPGDAVTLTVRLPVITNHDGVPVAHGYAADHGVGLTALVFPAGTVVQVTRDGKDVSGKSATVPARSTSAPPATGASASAPPASGKGTKSEPAAAAKPESKPAPSKGSLFGKR